MPHQRGFLQERQIAYPYSRTNDIAHVHVDMAPGAPNTQQRLRNSASIACRFYGSLSLLSTTSASKMQDN